MVYMKFSIQYICVSIYIITEGTTLNFINSPHLCTKYIYAYI